MSTVTTDPFSLPEFADQKPAPARLEVLERHRGPDRLDNTMPLCPNIVRVNGVSLLCSTDSPVALDFDEDLRMLVVSVRLQARRLAVGEEPTRVVPDAPDRRNRSATVELPPAEHDVVGPAGETGPAYAVVNGHKLLLGPGGVKVDPISSDLRDRLLTVTLPLVCRSVVFDDVVEPGGTE